MYWPLLFNTNTHGEILQTKILRSPYHPVASTLRFLLILRFRYRSNRPGPAALPRRNPGCTVGWRFVRTSLSLAGSLSTCFPPVIIDHFGTFTFLSFSIREPDLTCCRQTWPGDGWLSFFRWIAFLVRSGHGRGTENQKKINAYQICGQNGMQ